MVSGQVYSRRRCHCRSQLAPRHMPRATCRVPSDAGCLRRSMAGNEMSMMEGVSRLRGRPAAMLSQVESLQRKPAWRRSNHLAAACEDEVLAAGAGGRRLTAGVVAGEREAGVACSSSSEHRSQSRVRVRPQSLRQGCLARPPISCVNAVQCSALHRGDQTTTACDAVE